MIFDFLRRKPKDETPASKTPGPRPVPQPEPAPVVQPEPVPVAKPAPAMPQPVPEVKPQPGAAPKAPGEKAVDVADLIKWDKKVIWDASAVNLPGFHKFVDANFRTMKEAAGKVFFIPAFEAAQATERASTALRFLTEQGVLNTMAYQGVTGYEGLLKKIAPMGQTKGRLCFVVTQPEKRRAILSAARAANVFVQLYGLNDQGQLTQYVPAPRTERTEPRQPRTPGAHPGREAFALCTQPERMRILRIPLSVPLKTGDTVYDSSRDPVKLVKQELVNPTSITYSTDRPGVWAKIYDPKSLNTFAEEKTRRMLTKKVTHKGLCWPTDTLQSSDGLFVGSLMPEAKGKPLHLSVFKQAGIQTNFPGWTKPDLCDLAATILETITYLHSMNILLGCINPAAIRVVSKDEVYFVDTDNYQVEGFPSLVYNVSFTPPEFQGRKLYLSGKENENFAVAMLVFMLMMPGKTPYALDQARSPSDAIVEKQFAFSNGAVYGMPSLWRFMWSHLYVFWGPFYHTFQKNGKYENPADRISAARWLDTVRYYKKQILESGDPESLKLYPQTFHRKPGETFYTCRKCGVAHPERYFDRRYFGDFRICNSCIDKRSDVSFTCRACNRVHYYTNRTAMFHASMKRADAEWKDQKYCRDCKNKTIPCATCGKETPYYYLRNGRCPDCSQQLRNQTYTVSTCRDCGSRFEISVADHEYNMSRGYSDPVRCKSCRARRKSERY